DTLLVAEITNDAATDLSGDGWHGAMTYANLTRPLWGWLSRQSEGSWYFGMPRGPIPSYTGEQVLEAHQRFIAGFPWPARLHNMNALDTHDTPRFLTSAPEGALPVAFGLCVALPGIPLVWAGDEFGLTGEDGEHSRTAMPWDRADEAGEYIELYRDLIALRRNHPVLSVGGVRWLHSSADALVLVREAAEECVLVFASRARSRVRLPRWSFAGRPDPLWGPGSVAEEPDGWELSAEGASFTAWALPGVSAPGRRL
ncbi:MAG: DUF3459 domain-containing protein, partial [Pseudomonadota bacterium]|nr:DUF3459 domain-containing protein [Pseudomonadota bacterium]